MKENSPVVKNQKQNRYPSWFHSDISRHKVVSLLKSDGTDGAWLVRNSKNFPGDFTLSILRGGKVGFGNVSLITPFRGLKLSFSQE